MKSILPIATLLCLPLMQIPAPAQGEEGNGLILLPIRPVPPHEVEPPREFTPAFAFTLHVVDEDGEPVEGAAFRAAGGLGAVTGLTDENGRAEVEGRSIGFVEIKITKDGFYWSHPEFPQVENDPRDYDEIHRDGLRPWNPELKVVMRRIGNPIPMIVRWSTYGRVAIPVIGEEVAYDLFIGDWLPPHGEGKAADLIIKREYFLPEDEPRSTTLSIRFANDHDGFHPLNELPAPGSVLRFPRFAPDDGYNLREVVLRAERSAGPFPRITHEEQPGRYGYFFRVQTEVDEDGKVVRAYYGKITEPLYDRGVIRMGLTEEGVKRSGAGSFMMPVYLNPEPNDRNTEFDTQNNLVPGSPRVYTPPG